MLPPSPSFLGPLRCPCPTHFSCKVDEFAWSFLGRGELCSKAGRPCPGAPPACHPHASSLLTVQTSAALRGLCTRGPWETPSLTSVPKHYGN